LSHDRVLGAGALRLDLVAAVAIATGAVRYAAAKMTSPGDDCTRFWVLDELLAAAGVSRQSSGAVAV
jgi:hypothetical protein